ncbi:hypothetical protein JCM6882_008717 [Rhodosporidiobolus microsporus]
MLSSSVLARSLRPALRAPRRTLTPSPTTLSLTRPFSSLRPSSPLFDASKVAQKPASEDVKDMGKNAAEEARGVARTVADAVSGANDVTGQRAGRENFGAGDVTADIAAMTSLGRAVPRETITWGAAGLLPYAGTSLATIHFARQAYQAAELGKTDTIDPEAAFALLEHVQLLQVQYGAIILSFLGAVHWGFEWSKYGGVQGNSRYLLGVAPVLAGWGSLLVPGQMALISHWAAFFAMWWVDQKATTKGWTPRWYSTYRFWLTSVVGGSILISLAARGYYSVDPTLARTESQLAEMQSGKRPSSLPKGDSVQLGDMKAVKGKEDSDAYVQFVNVEKEKEKEEEEKKQKEEEAQKKKEEEDQQRKDEAAAAKKEEETKKARAKLTEQVKKVEDK